MTVISIILMILTIRTFLDAVDTDGMDSVESAVHRVHWFHSKKVCRLVGFFPSTLLTDDDDTLALLLPTVAFAPSLDVTSHNIYCIDP